MTRYAFDADRLTVVRTYETPAGDTASDLVELKLTDPEAGPALTRALNSVSAAFWRTFTHPAETAPDGTAENTEGWRRQHEREGITKALTALTTPNLPSETGMLVVSYTRTVEAGHNLGRLLSRFDSQELTTAIVEEVHAEVQAIERAEAGNLSGRSQQAASMSRPVASPGQVDAAHAILLEDPFASPIAFATIEPVSAAVAAARWLACAARISATASRVPFAQVLIEADEIEALPWERPTEVLREIKRGVTPENAVTSLVAAALDIAGGDLDAFLNVATIPDISRPGPDLLEDLLYGIHGAALVWSREDAGGNAPDPDDFDSETDEEEYWEARYAARHEVFTAKLRKKAELERKKSHPNARASVSTDKA